MQKRNNIFYLMFLSNIFFLQKKIFYEWNYFDEDRNQTFIVILILICFSSILFYKFLVVNFNEQFSF